VSDCRVTFAFTPGDGHTIGAHWETCHRREGHSGSHASRWNVTPEQQAEDDDARRKSAADLRAFIFNTAKMHKRRTYATEQLERLLRSSPDQPFTIVVPVDPDGTQ
jgi:hypothetical protein